MCKLNILGIPGGSDSKESACNAEELDAIPGLGRSPGGGNDNPLQYSCLENPMDEEPGGVKSMRSQRVGHNYSNLACVQWYVLSNFSRTWC